MTSKGAFYGHCGWNINPVISFCWFRHLFLFWISISLILDILETIRKKLKVEYHWTGSVSGPLCCYANIAILNVNFKCRFSMNKTRNTFQTFYHVIQSNFLSSKPPISEKHCLYLYKFNTTLIHQKFLELIRASVWTANLE